MVRLVVPKTLYPTCETRSSSAGFGLEPAEVRGWNDVPQQLVLTRLERRTHEVPQQLPDWSRPPFQRTAGLSLNHSCGREYSMSQDYAQRAGTVRAFRNKVSPRDSAVITAMAIRYPVRHCERVRGDSKRQLAEPAVSYTHLTLPTIYSV